MIEKEQKKAKNVLTKNGRTQKVEEKLDAYIICVREKLFDQNV